MPKSKKRETSAPARTEGIPNPEGSHAPIPEELETVWDTEIAAIFADLSLKHQDFLLCYLRCGNQAEAYRQVYNPLAKDHLATNGGGQVLASIGISSILLKFANQKTAVLFKVINGYSEMAEATKPNWVKDENGQYENAGNDPDWQARKEAFSGMRKVFGLDAPTETKLSGEILSKVVQVELPKKDSAV